MLGKVLYFALTGGRSFLREKFLDGEANIETMFGRSELRVVNDLFGRMIVEDPSKRLQTMEAVIADIDAAQGRLFGRRETEHRLVFMFGAPSGDRHSGDHPGLQNVPVWLPRTSLLLVDLRTYPGITEAQFALELWADGGRILDSGCLTAGRNEVRVQAGNGGRWTSLRVRGDNDWGTANISNLVVHAVCGEGYW